MIGFRKHPTAHELAHARSEFEHERRRADKLSNDLERALGHLSECRGQIRHWQDHAASLVARIGLTPIPTPEPPPAPVVADPRMMWRQP